MPSTNELPRGKKAPALCPALSMMSLLALQGPIKMAPAKSQLCTTIIAWACSEVTSLSSRHAITSIDVFSFLITALTLKELKIIIEGLILIMMPCWLLDTWMFDVIVAQVTLEVWHSTFGLYYTIEQFSERAQMYLLLHACTTQPV